MVIQMIKFIKNQPYYGVCIDKKVKLVYLGRFENLLHIPYAIFENCETHEILTLQIHNLNIDAEYVILNEDLTIINADDGTGAKSNDFVITFDDCYLAYDFNNDTILDIKLVDIEPNRLYFKFKNNIKICKQCGTSKLKNPLTIKNYRIYYIDCK